VQEALPAALLVVPRAQARQNTPLAPYEPTGHATQAPPGAGR
jgi:hypothetical protein